VLFSLLSPEVVGLFCFDGMTLSACQRILNRLATKRVKCGAGCAIARPLWLTQHNLSALQHSERSGEIMGRELQCNVQLGKQSGIATAHLDSTGIQLRGSIRGKWLPTQLDDLAVRNDSLVATTADGALAISLGKIEAEKWLHALKNPKSRTEKLGLKAKMRVYVFSENDEISGEISSADCIVSKRIEDADLMFMPVMNSKALNGFSKLAEDVDRTQHVWVLREKGSVTKVPEKMIFEAAAAVGFKPTKTLRFSEELTADRYSRAARK
jgi:hypothetical protein